jgi:PAS domain-containing protein
MQNVDTSKTDDKGKALLYINTLLDVAREPFLILDNEFRVIRANASFYLTFQVEQKETEGNLVFDLGDKQWDIPMLKTLLEAILPEKKAVKDFEVEHDFPKIGKKVMMLNGRQLDSLQLIILAFEDITLKNEIKLKAELYTKELEGRVIERTKELSDRVKDLEELTKVMVGRELKMSELKQEIARIKKIKQNGNNGGGEPAA